MDTMLAFSLLTPRPSCPVTSKMVHFRKDAIFVQYNIARMKSILDRHLSEYALHRRGNLCFSLLANEHEWNIAMVNLLKMQQLNQSLIRQLTECDTVECHFDYNKIVDQLKKLAHSFSCYYRNVKILAEPVDRLVPLIETRVAFCKIILNAASLCFRLFGIATADRM